MSARSPRRQSPAVYRRRRLTLAILVLLIGALLWWLTSLAVGALFDDDEQAGPGSSQSQEPGAGSSGSDSSGSESSSAAPSEESDETESGEEESGEEASGSAASPSEETSQEEGGQCAPGDIEVRASTGEQSYTRSDAPLLILQVENTGSADCTLDLGTGAQEFSLQTAGEQVFSTSECGGETTELETEMAPGDVETAQLTWPLSDSSGDCTEPGDVPSGEYQLTVSIDGISSDPATFTLTDS